jgi:hypothetical protein
MNVLGERRGVFLLLSKGWVSPFFQQKASNHSFRNFVT